MKKILLLLLILSASAPVRACAACGCANSGSLFANRWTAGISVQPPLAQNLSSGEVMSKARGLVAWLF